MSDPIDAYLAQIHAALPGPDRKRRDILAELRDGLCDAAGAHRAAGLPAAAAVAAALDEFGAPACLAAAYRPELDAAQGRRLILALVLTAPVMLLVWMHAAAMSDGARSLALSWHWVVAPPVPLATLALAVATLAASAVLAGQRVFRARTYRPGLARRSAAIAGYSVAATDLGILILLGTRIAFAPPGSLASVPVTVAALLTAIRLALTQRAARRCAHAMGHPRPTMRWHLAG